MIDNIRPPRSGRRDYTGEIISTRDAPKLEPKKFTHTETSVKSKAKPSHKHTRLRSKLLAMIVLALACVAGVSFMLLRPKAPPPAFPVGIARTVSYPIYYADNKPDGYTYKDGSASNHAGIIFYTLQNRKKNIIVSQQNAPIKPVNLKSLPKYTNLDIPIGQAVIGTGLGNPSIVIITPKTIIQITSNKGVSKDDIMHLAQKLTLLNQQSITP